VHNFPTPHTDYLTHYVDYRVPVEKASELIAFDGSVILDRTAGQIGARCDHEAYNTLTLNLAVEIIEGRRTVEQARELYAETAAAFVMGRDASYAERLRFEPPSGETGDPDEAIIAPHMAHQVAQKARDMIGRDAAARMRRPGRRVRRCPTPGAGGCGRRAWPSRGRRRHAAGPARAPRRPGPVTWHRR